MLRKTYRFRLPLLIAFPTLCVVALIARLAFLQIVHYDYFLERAEGQHRKSIPIRPKRGAILSRDGVELAVSSPAYAAYADSQLIAEDLHHEIAERLSVILGGNRLRFLQRLRSGSRAVTLGRKLDERTKERLQLLARQYRLPTYAIWYEEEGKRHYPRGDLASHIVGFVRLNEYGDNEGLAGIEARYDDYLRGSLEKYEAARTAIHKRLEPIAEDAYRKAFGDSLVLTIDSVIQHTAQATLAERCEELEAEGGVAIAYEVKTGRLLALANWPGYDPNEFSTATFNQMRNRGVTDAIEPGSVMKTLTMAILFDAGLISPETLIDCEGGRARINGRYIKDAPGHYLHMATIREIFKYSSNVGTDKAATLIEPAQFDLYLRRFGLGQKTGIEMPGEVDGQLRPMSEWSGFTMTSLPMGYELRLTAIQVAQSIGAIANGGVMMEPHVVEEIYDHSWRLKYRARPRRKHRVIGPLAAAQTLSLMEETVESGTGTKAAIEGYRVGGKTGTTHKYNVEAGAYSSRNYISSFCGILPLSDPEILIYIYVDDPKGKKYGGDVAAPVFKSIAEEAIRVRGIAPDAEEVLTGGHAGVEMKLAEVRAERLLIEDSAKPAKPLQTVDVEESEPEAEEQMEEPALEDMLALSSAERFAVRQRLREQEEAALAPPAPPMPDLTGMTMAEVREALSGNSPARVVFQGSGRVVDQEPKPGGRVRNNGSVTVVFAH